MVEIELGVFDDSHVHVWQPPYLPEFIIEELDTDQPITMVAYLPENYKEIAYQLVAGGWCSRETGCGGCLIWR